MGKYLGEDVLKAGLAGKASRQEGIVKLLNSC